MKFIDQLGTYNPMLPKDTPDRVKIDVEKAKKIKPSDRGELEITSVNNSYLKDNMLNLEVLGRGMTWLDTGTDSSMFDASNFVRTLTERQGMQVGSPDEIAFRKKWITKEALKERAKLFSKNDYGHFLNGLIKK